MAHKEADGGAESTHREEDPLLGTIRLQEQNTWIYSFKVSTYEALQRDFVAEPGDVVLASVMKTGTTWMMAILHSLMACVYSFPNLLDKYNPHQIVPGMEIESPWPSHMPSPRLLSTHLPFHALPQHVRQGNGIQGAKIVYVTRNPRDTFVSFQNFFKRFAETTKHGIPPQVDKDEELFQSYCAGHFHGGPFAENVLSYSKESRVRPEKVLVVAYEHLQADCEGVICKIGDFLGYPSDLVRSNATFIAQRCSFGSLSALDFNKITTSVDGYKPPHATYFNKGKTGEWKRHFTSAMEQRIEAEIEQKLVLGGFPIKYV